MSDNTYWGNVPRHAHILEPGEFEDNNGTENDRPAIWLGECLVEGSREAWLHFAQELIKELGEVQTSSYKSDSDGVPVVEMDHDGEIRVYLNDGAIWSGNTRTHQHTECVCVEETIGE
ncbi:MAG: hypothetical protein GX862_03415 [Leucobacter sp.]|nr:hypothetical protein [Leucobacter sp.]